MINFKAIIIGIAMQVVIMSVVISAIAMAGVQFGSIDSGLYILFMEFACFIAVAVSSFFCARLAWSKAFLYGVIMSSICVLIRLIVCIILDVPIDISALAVKAGIYYSLGFCCAVLGVSIVANEKI